MSQPAAPSQQPQTEASSPSRAKSWHFWAGCAVLGLFLLLAYANSFKAPFLLDDLDSVKYNKSIQDLGTALFPPGNSGLTVAGRPLLNFSFALNRALLGPAPGDYRWGNLLIHFSAALLLWGTLWRTFHLPVLARQFGEHALPLAWLIAALWALHPMQTESVTYVVQRAESLAGLCALATLFAFVRTAETGSTLWSLACVACCALGMSAKETMAAIPIFIVLFDRALLARSFAAVWKLRGKLHLALAATWLLLVLLIIQAGGRGSTVGFSRISPLEYLLTQGWGILGYVGKALLPIRLVFDYGAIVEKETLKVVVGLLGTGALFVTTCVLLRKKPVAALPGAWFFLILAPSSSIIPVLTQTLAEHRMYLPLASVILILVLGVYHLWRQLTWILCPLLVLAAASGTYLRNQDYQSGLLLWEDTVAKVPDNVRALNNLGIAYENAGRVDEAIHAYAQAIELAPQFGQALTNYGWILVTKGLGSSDTEAPTQAPNAELIKQGIDFLARALETEPDNFFFASNYGSALKKLQRFDEALPLLRKAYERAPDKAAHSFNLANTLMELGRYDESYPLYQEAVRLSPLDSDIHANFGILLRRMGKAAESVALMQKAVSLAPESGRAHSNLGVSLLFAGRTQEALVELQKSLSLNPRLPQARYYLGTSLAEAGKTHEAIEQFEALLKLAPPTAHLLSNLGVLYARAGDFPNAIRCLKQAVALDPKHEAARENLARLKHLAP